jgi:hypothetical protein
MSPRLGFFELDLQVDLTQDLGYLFALPLVADVRHRMPVGVRCLGNLKGLPGAASGRLLYLGNDLVEGMHFIVEEDHHPWLTEACSDVLFRTCLRLRRHGNTSSVRPVTSSW